MLPLHCQSGDSQADLAQSPNGFFQKMPEVVGGQNAPLREDFRNRNGGKNCSCKYSDPVQSHRTCKGFKQERPLGSERKFGHRGNGSPDEYAREPVIHEDDSLHIYTREKCSKGATQSKKGGQPQQFSLLLVHTRISAGMLLPMSNPKPAKQAKVDDADGAKCQPPGE